MIKQDIARRLPVYMQAADGSPVLGLTWEDVDVYYTKEGDASLSEKTLADDPVEWFEIGQGLYKILFTVAELDTIGFFEYFVTGTGALQYPGLAQISKYLLDDIAGSEFDIGTDTLELIRDAITSFAPTTHSANAGNITVGSLIAGTYAKTGIEDEDYWQIQCDAGDDALGIDVDLTFSVDEGRSPVNILIRGRIHSANGRDVDVYAWNYELSAWEKLTSSATQMRHSVNDKSYLYNLSFNHHKHEVVAHGEVKLRFVGQGTGFTTSHNLYLDQVIIGSVVEGTVQPDVIAHAVWGHDIESEYPSGNGVAGGMIIQIDGKTINLPDDPASETKIDIAIADISVVAGKIDVVDSNVDLILAGTISINSKVDIMDANIDTLILRRDHNVVGD